MKIRIAVLFLFFSILMGCKENPNAWPVVTFDKAEWAKTKEEERFVFARDLVEHKRLLGMDKQEVINLLGKPSFVDAENGYMTYVLRIGSGDLYILDIRFKLYGPKSLVDEVFVRAD